MKERLKVLSVMSMVLFLSLTVVSCSNDDEEKENNSIVGTWKFKSVAAGEIKTNSTTNDEKVKINVTSKAASDFSGFIYVFREDKTVTLTDAKYTDDISNGTYTFKDGVLKLTWGSEDDYDIYNATLSDNILTIEDDYVNYYDWLKQAGQLSEIGIDDSDFQITKAAVKISFNRQ